ASTRGKVAGGCRAGGPGWSGEGCTPHGGSRVSGIHGQAEAKPIVAARASGITWPSAPSMLGAWLVEATPYSVHQAVTSSSVGQGRKRICTPCWNGPAASASAAVAFAPRSGRFVTRALRRARQWRLLGPTVAGATP